MADENGREQVNKFSRKGPKHVASLIDWTNVLFTLKLLNCAAGKRQRPPLESLWLLEMAKFEYNWSIWKQIFTWHFTFLPFVINHMLNSTCTRFNLYTAIKFSISFALYLKYLSFCCHIIYITSSEKKEVTDLFPPLRWKTFIFILAKRCFLFFLQSKLLPNTLQGWLKHFKSTAKRWL